MRHVLRAVILLPVAAVFSVQSSEGGDVVRPQVEVIRTPDGGIQPQAVIDVAGTIHLVYFKGDPAGGDLFYVSSKTTPLDFSRPIRVNSQPGSAIAIGTIRGAQIALGKGGRVHVAWNGSQKARPANPIKGSPMLYCAVRRVAVRIRAPAQPDAADVRARWRRDDRRRLRRERLCRLARPNHRSPRRRGRSQDVVRSVRG